MAIRVTTAIFIDRARSIHGEKYDYSKTIYTIAKEKIIITCKVHGDFSMLPGSHTFLKQGCSTCADHYFAAKRTKPFYKFVEDARNIHGDRYEYYAIAYLNDSLKIPIRCSEHGIFIQSPNRHLQGNGCHDCARGGFKTSKKGFLYLLFSDDSSCMKVGITNSIQNRMKDLKRKTPFGFALAHTIEGDGSCIATLEKDCHLALMSCGFSGFDGASEWFRMDKDAADQIKSIKTLESH